MCCDFQSFLFLHLLWKNSDKTSTLFILFRSPNPRFFKYNPCMQVRLLFEKFIDVIVQEIDQEIPVLTITMSSCHTNSVHRKLVDVFKVYQDVCIYRRN